MTLLFLTSLLAFYLAWNLGANDVANSMGTAVGSKALTLRQALAIAGILEFAGALLLGQEVSATLATQIINPAHFTPSPQEFIAGMIAVVIACGVWLNIATLFGLPVSSSHAVVGAIAGFAWVASSLDGVAWQAIGLISLTWVITPVVSGAIAAALYSWVKYWILDQPDPLMHLLEWIPWLSACVVGTFGCLVFPTLVEKVEWGNHILPIEQIAVGGTLSVGLAIVVWRTALTQVESSLIPFQIFSAGLVAFAHGANDVGNAIAPLSAIVYASTTGSIPNQSFATPLWVLIIGGVGIVGGLATWGKKVIATVGEGIIPLQPSVGFCAQWGTAVTVLVASQLGFPVSTSHAIVGSVVGIGLVQGNVQFKPLRGIGLAWVVTIPIAASLSALIFEIIR
ncbi:MAG: inorganic phosphate transporter [Timaviella obliquedivisa GSE-PSE-MK23-08B]|jgi:PiT family inorganic phosphate transporter|nr:inorganic phosphate transporter [Timaviella obliquedivisa GSE-PSE-MK23-08B]